MGRILILLLSLAAVSCSLKDSGEKKDFYNSIEGWDIKHVPIFPPFRASSTYPGQWLITGSQKPLHLGKNRGGDIPVQSFGVTKNHIYGKTQDGQWFLFNASSLVYSEYLTETELLETLNMYELNKNKIETCDTYFQQVSKNQRCYWHPKIGEQYPTFRDYRPDKFYTIAVRGKGEITDLRIKETIKKAVSKIYYFKIACENSKNELFYISFDYSPPRLFHNNDVFIAYSENNSSLDISIYTPFSVAKSNGISETDRTVISKQIELK